MDLSVTDFSCIKVSSCFLYDQRVFFVTRIERGITLAMVWTFPHRNARPRHTDGPDFVFSKHNPSVITVIS